MIAQRVFKVASKSLNNHPCSSKHITRDIIYDKVCFCYSFKHKNYFIKITWWCFWDIFINIPKAVSKNHSNWFEKRFLRTRYVFNFSNAISIQFLSVFPFLFFQIDTVSNIYVKLKNYMYNMVLKLINLLNIEIRKW